MLVKFGGGITAASGSVGGNTFSRNRYGAYMRVRTKPVNPQTDRQSRVRAIMSQNAAAYLDSASSAQRIEWGVYATNIVKKNKLSEDIRWSGYNHFIASKTAAKNAGLPAILDGPVIFTLPGEDPTFAVTASAATQLATITFADRADWCSEDNAGMIISIGIPQNASRAFFDGPYKHAGLIAGDLSVPITSPQTIALPYPAVENQKLWVRGRIIRADGRLSDWFQVSISVAA